MSNLTEYEIAQALEAIQEIHPSDLEKARPKNPQRFSDIKTNTSIQLSSSIQIKVTAAIKQHLSDFNYITKLNNQNVFFPTKGRKEDIIKYLTMNTRKLATISATASPFRFGKYKDGRVS